MTRKNAKELLPFIKAYAEGKQIQSFNGGKWIDLEYPNFSEEPCLYRIKPESEPKYRPFKSIEECCQEMQKHQPFGWLKYGESICNIQNITLDSVTIINYEEICCFRFYESFMNFTFIDGSPFGIKEE